MYAKYDISNDVKSVETIAFLDLTGGKEFNLADVKLLPLKEVVEQIKLDTGREIKINNKTALESIGIVKYDLPLGYALFANKDIEKNQILFNYGGTRTNIKPVTNAYLLEIDAEDSLDAEHQGDLGSLCMHLFDPLQFEGYTEISIDETQYNKIQFHNLSRELIQTDNAIDYQFRAREFIRQGSALGFTYGFSYWLTRSTSPLIMSGLKIQLDLLLIPINAL